MRFTIILTLCVAGCIGSGGRPDEQQTNEYRHIDHACTAEDTGASCDRDDGTVGICAGFRMCLSECETVEDCEYPNGTCEGGLCWYSVN